MTIQRSRKLRLHIFGSKLHKWLAVFVGVQALLWMATGTIMSFLKIEHVRSEHVISANTKTVNGKPVVELKRVNGSATLHEAVTGRKLSPLSRDTAEQIALAAWTGPDTTIKSSKSIEAPVGTEFGGPFPAWQVQFADPDGTRLYIDASTGAVLAARSDTWRFFDFVWGLHIMDWIQRDRINSWWLLLFGIGGTVIVISGFVLLANRFPKLRRPRAKRP